MSDLVHVVRRKRKSWLLGKTYDPAIKSEGLRPVKAAWFRGGFTSHQVLMCKLFGHRPKSPGIGGPGEGANLCRCGADILQEEKSVETRLSHVPTCFLFGHTCIRVTNRSGHHEFVCRTCGHPLLFEEEKRTDYAPLRSLEKRQKYYCSLFGHRVHKVVERDEMTEYACRCGHSFLKKQSDLNEIKHPFVCLYTGHLVNFLTYQGEYAEYLCRNCGHTFYYPHREQD